MTTLKKKVEENTYKCPICKQSYYKREIGVVCAVLHKKGDCCHYGEELAPQPPQPRGKEEAPKGEACPKCGIELCGCEAEQIEKHYGCAHLPDAHQPSPPDKEWGGIKGTLYKVAYSLINYDGKTRCAWCEIVVDNWTKKEIDRHLEAHTWGDQEADRRVEEVIGEIEKTKIDENIAFGKLDYRQEFALKEWKDYIIEKLKKLSQDKGK